MTVVATSRGSLFGFGHRGGLGEVERDFVLLPIRDENVHLRVGDPVWLGIMYAENPLLTLVGLLGTGLAAGYFIWGRQNRSGGMSGFVSGTPQQHRDEYQRIMRGWQGDPNPSEVRLMMARADQEHKWFP